MPDSTFTLDDLKKLLLEAAGDEGALDGDDLDAAFGELGFDSIAMLEVAARISRDHDVNFDDAAEATTPRRLLALVNGQAAVDGRAGR